MQKSVRAISMALALNGAAAMAQDVPGPSLRIATYNAYLLSPAFKCFNPADAVPIDCFGQVEGETEIWARRLAKTILANKANIDVVAINEAWDEDAKRILARRLRNVYPVQIRKLDKSLTDSRSGIFAQLPEAMQTAFSVLFGARFTGEDSGLMLFAKKDFKVLALPDDSMRWGKVSDETIDATTPDVAFSFFEACGDFDCYAAKGAGLVRLQHIASGRVHNVVFTHMQADYPEAGDFYRDERQKQFDQVRHLIETSLGTPVLDRISQGTESLIFLGDLNVPFLKERTEWDGRFTGNGFFRKSLYESWYFSGSRADRTPTNDTDEERLDYIFASPNEGSNTGPVSRRQCVQHVTVPIAFRDLESDHAMVRADIATGYYHCSPSLALTITLSANKTATIDKAANGATDITRINSAGGMQWFYLDTGSAGTYSIGTSNPDAVAIEIYAPDDLTRPIPRYNETPRPPPPSAIKLGFATDQYSLPSKFYIRTSGVARTTIADYALYVERHSCATQEKACILSPNVAQSVTLSGQTLPPGQLTPQNEAWFRFDVVGTAYSGKLQTIKVDAGLAAAPRVVSQITAFGGGDPLVKASGTNTDTYEGKVADGGKGFLVIKQSSAAAQSTIVTGKLDSNIRFLDVGNLICLNETNPETGSDDIFTRVNVDGTKWRAPATDFIEFDCDSHADTEAWANRVGYARIAFLDEFAMQIFEDDDVSANDSSNKKVAPALTSSELQRMDDKLIWNFDGGKYRFNYNLYRRPPGTVANP